MFYKEFQKGLDFILYDVHQILNVLINYVIFIDLNP